MFAAGSCLLQSLLAQQRGEGVVPLNGGRSAGSCLQLYHPFKQCICTTRNHTHNNEACNANAHTHTHTHTHHTHTHTAPTAHVLRSASDLRIAGRHRTSEASSDRVLSLPGHAHFVPARAPEPGRQIAQRTTTNPRVNDHHLLLRCSTSTQRNTFKHGERANDCTNLSLIHI